MKTAGSYRILGALVGVNKEKEEFRCDMCHYMLLKHLLNQLKNYLKRLLKSWRK